MTALTFQRHDNTLPARSDWAVMLEMADILVKSGMLPSHIKTPQAAVAIIQKGRELGIPPMHALSNIVNIQGKPTANAELMLALVYRDHGDGALIFTESTATICTARYQRRAWPVASIFSFTIEDAQRAGLTGSQTWQKYPAAMLRARCISAVARMAFPDSIGGMYTPEELGAQVDVSDGGEVIITGNLTPPARHALDVLNDEPAAPAVIDMETGEIHDQPVPSTPELSIDQQFAEVYRLLDAATNRADLSYVKQQIRAWGLQSDDDVVKAYAARHDAITKGREPAGATQAALT